MGIELEIRSQPYHRLLTSHEGHYLHWLASGHATIHDLSGRRLLERGDLAFCPGGSRYRIQSDPGAAAVLWTLRIRASAFHPSSPADQDAWATLNRLARRYDEQGHRLNLAQTTRRTVREIFQQLDGVNELSLDRRRMLLKARTLELLCAIVDDPIMRPIVPGAELLEADRQRIEPALWHMDRNFHNACPIRQLAALTGLRPSRFHALFRALTGQTPSRYLMRLRIGHACRMLIETDETILNIAMSSGYNSTSQFYAAFVRICGLSPARFRRQAHSAPEPGPTD